MQKQSTVEKDKACLATLSEQLGAAAATKPPAPAQRALRINAILPAMQKQHSILDLITRAKDRGAAPYLLGLLDALEPAAPIVASTLLVAQPLANLWRAGDACRELADLLDSPAGTQQLRNLLENKRLD